MYAKFCYMIPPLSGSSGLSKCRWRPANKLPPFYLVFLLRFVVSRLNVCESKGKLMFCHYVENELTMGVCLLCKSEVSFENFKVHLETLKVRVDVETYHIGTNTSIVNFETLS